LVTRTSTATPTITLTPSETSLYTNTATITPTSTITVTPSAFETPPGACAPYLYGNNTFVNGIANGANGANTSRIFAPDVNNGFTADDTNSRVAEDFTVSAAEVWTPQGVTLYAYQEGSGTTKHAARRLIDVMVG
jgi:hypothetical protein